MKNLIIVLFMLLELTAFSQRAITLDTIKGAETLTFASMQGAKVISATCVQVGGTSDGTLTLYGSTDNSVWIFMNFVGHDLGVASPKASLTGTDLNQITITSGLVANWVITSDHFQYYKVVAVGTSGDTTSVSINWSK